MSMVRQQTAPFASFSTIYLFSTEYYEQQQPAQSPPQSSPPPESNTQSEEHAPTPKESSPSPAFLRRLSLFPPRPMPKSYTVEAICALPHTAPSYALASSLCMSHLLTGSEDGYIRDYDLFTGLNGKTFLSAPQRHHCGVVEGILKYAPIRYWWENPSDLKREEGAEEPPLSPVYSLLMQSDALWSLAGTEVWLVVVPRPRSLTGIQVRQHQPFHRSTRPWPSLLRPARTSWCGFSHVYGTRRKKLF